MYSKDNVMDDAFQFIWYFLALNFCHCSKRQCFIVIKALTMCPPFAGFVNSKNQDEHVYFLWLSSKMEAEIWMKYPPLKLLNTVYDPGILLHLKYWKCLFRGIERCWPDLHKSLPSKLEDWNFSMMISEQPSSTPNVLSGYAKNHLE